MSYEPHEDEHSILEWLKNAPDMEALWTLWVLCALWAYIDIIFHGDHVFSCDENGAHPYLFELIGTKPPWLC